MSLLLCRQENVRHPYYMENLGIHLYSSQELSYVIFNYPLLVMEDFVDDNLLNFLREELNQGFLALKIERFLKNGGSTDEVLAMILSEGDYYSSAEIGRFRQLLSNFRSKHPADYGKTKADELFSMRQYGKAAAIYAELTEYPKDTFVSDLFIGKVWNNLGACYARMFRTGQAMEAFEKAWQRTGQKSSLEMMVILSKLDNGQRLSDQVKALVDEETEMSCQKRIDAAREAAAKHAKMMELEALFEKDSLKRRVGEETLIGAWRQEYRRIR